MKRLRAVWVGLALAGAALTANAQEVNWQVRGGLGYSCVPSMSTSNWQLAYRIGAGVDIPISRSGRLRLQPALTLAQKGWQFEGYYGSEQIVPASFNTRLHYLELPLLMAFRLRIGQGSFITFRYGPYVAYGLTGRTRMELTDFDYRHTFSENHFRETCSFYGSAYDSEKHRLEYPKLHRWEAGLAYGIDLTLGHAVIGLGLHYALTPLCDGPMLGNTFGNVVGALFFGKPKNLSAEFSVGYQF